MPEHSKPAMRAAKAIEELICDRFRCADIMNAWDGDMRPELAEIIDRETTLPNLMGAVSRAMERESKIGCICDGNYSCDWCAYEDALAKAEGSDDD